MNQKNVIAVFDIGKTNKKLFVFDEQYQVLIEQTEQFAETVDDDGDPCENLQGLAAWVRLSLNDLQLNKDISLKALNFSTYGASFVHIDQEGRPVAPLYNYLKAYPENLKEGFYEKYGGKITFSMHTASPVLGSLNSGLQLYRLKYEKPGLYDRIHYSLHLPQYMSYLVTGRAYSDITSIGCHTGMWNFPQNHYHEWLYREGISTKLAPIFPSDQLMATQLNGEAILAGVGLHDSSAALIPYIANFTEPFVLISTGTWCISLNPFNQERLTAEELQQDCLCYMEYRGKPIKASRLFAGYEHEQAVERLADHFQVGIDYYKTVRPDAVIMPEMVTRLKMEVIGKALPEKEPVFLGKALGLFRNYEEAYHYLVYTIVVQQVVSTNLVLKGSTVKRIFVDGGFGKNPIYMQLLAAAYPQLNVFAASIAQATAIGAALAGHHYWNKQNPPLDIIDVKRYTASHPVEL
jgi:sugar (pentulose or hexulose) kinase